MVVIFEVMQIKERNITEVCFSFFVLPLLPLSFEEGKAPKQCTLSPDLSYDWLTQKNDNVMILIFNQQEEYDANLPISNGIRKKLKLHEIHPSIDYH